MRVLHYYHCYAAGSWDVPVREHIEALGRAELCDIDMTVGLIGPAGRRQEAREAIIAGMREQGLPGPVRWVEADAGWEQLTLQAIHDDVRDIPGDYAVMYAHTKGAHDTSDNNQIWRRAMTRHVVGDWKFCAGLLEAGYDAAGCHWMIQNGHWFFAGNFWWCSASHLRQLPAPENENRYSAEYWISQGADIGYKGSIPAPRAFSLLDEFAITDGKQS